MSVSSSNKRIELIRNSVVFQLKLMVDGFRDLVLLPISLVATLAGLLRGGEEPEREFNRVLNLGRDTERWINLFGRSDEADPNRAIASMDSLFNRVEETLKQQYKAEGTSERVQTQIASVLDAVQSKARKNKGSKNDEPEQADSAA